MTFLELAEKILTEEKHPLNEVEIWEIAKEKGYDRLISTKGKTPWKTIGANIYLDMRDNPETTVFGKTEGRPKRFILKASSYATPATSEGAPAEIVTKNSKTAYSERDLHSLLAYYASVYMKVATKTVFHEKSSKRSFNQWLHPDMVSVYYPFTEFDSDLYDLGLQMGIQLIRFFSFELKKELSFSNLRESFFQAVSNSSWANEGYLVTADLDQGEEFMGELRRLSTSFGIGVIRLDTEEPDDCEVVFPAKNKDELDLETMSKLSIENPDFKNFIIRTRKDIHGKEIYQNHYDKVLQPEELKLKYRKSHS
ncbi:HTH domain-containing protein [Heliophilum fasciatum]|nr:HTH domain-containing protein [Heliophilum fasciatum]MCW2279494.1 hypothetical protein [Heliophilum fasciatum]